MIPKITSADVYTKKLKQIKSLRTLAYEEGLDQMPEGIAADILTLAEEPYRRNVGGNK